MEIIPGDTIILHCTATTADPEIDVKVVRKWHMAAPRKWSDIGYHYLIKVDGTVEGGRPLTRVGAHTMGHNENIGVVYVGGVDSTGKPKDTLSPAQVSAFESLVATLRHAFLKPYKLAGHNQYANKACPSFHVPSKFKHIQL